MFEAMLPSVAGWIATAKTLEQEGTLGPAKIGPGTQYPVTPISPRVEVGAKPGFPTLPQLLNPFTAGKAVADAVQGTTGNVISDAYNAIKSDVSKSIHEGTATASRWGISAILLVVVIALFFVAFTGQAPNVSKIKEKIV